MTNGSNHAGPPLGCHGKQQYHQEQEVVLFDWKREGPQATFLFRPGTEQTFYMPVLSLDLVSVCFKF